jgi:hypothetical protein
MACKRIPPTVIASLIAIGNGNVRKTYFLSSNEMTELFLSCDVATVTSIKVVHWVIAHPTHLPFILQLEQPDHAPVMETSGVICDSLPAQATEQMYRNT